MVRYALLGLLLFSIPSMAAMYPWEEEPASRCRGKHYAEVTKDCKGKIELDFSLTPTQWQNSARRKRYYRSIGRLVIKVGRQLLADFGNQLSGTEKTAFMRALHALAWQESLWQHYIRYKNWFFVVLSGGSYTTCSTIGVLPKSHAPTALQTSLSTNASSRRKGTARSGARSTTASWNIYFIYTDARSLPCNNSVMDKLLGAYNQYASGFSYCHDEFSEDEKYRAYQTGAITGFGNHYKNRTWLMETK